MRYLKDDLTPLQMRACKVLSANATISTSFGSSIVKTPTNNQSYFFWSSQLFSLITVGRTLQVANTTQIGLVKSAQPGDLNAIFASQKSEAISYRAHGVYRTLQIVLFCVSACVYVGK